MTYDNVPFFIGLPNSGISSIGDGSGYMLPCNSVVAEHTVSSTPQKTLKGKVKRAKSFSADNFIDCRIDMSFYLMADNKMDNAYGFLFDNWDDGGLQRGNSTGNNFFPVMFGGNVYDECYLTNYSVSVKPFSPVVCNATLKSLKPPQKTSISGYTGDIVDYYDNISSSDKIVYGHTCKVSGLEGEVVGSKLVLDLNYDKTYKGKETTCIYDSEPKNYLITEVDAELDITSTGFKMFLPYEGSLTTGDISISLLNYNGSGIAKPSNGNGFEIRLPEKSFVSQESLGIRGSDTSQTKIRIKDSIL